MPVTELVFPSFRQEPEVLSQLRRNAPEIFKPFSGVDGLQGAFRGTILEEDGVPIDPSTMRTVLVLDWSDVPSFHNFFPKSPSFGRFVQMVKPLVNAPAVPELYEADDHLTSSSRPTLEVAQIIKTHHQEESEKAWQLFISSISKETAGKAHFHHAKGIESDEGTFLGVIGWSSLEAYNKIGTTGDFLRQLNDLGRGGKAHHVVAKLAPIESPM